VNVLYPLDRVNGVLAGVGLNDRKDDFIDDFDEDLEQQSRERFIAAGFIHDTINGRYLVPTRGRVVSLLYQQSFETLKGDQEYKSGTLTAIQYVPLPRESAFAGRVFYGRSTGGNPQVFRTGGIDRIRGVSSGSLDNKKFNVALASTELRMRIKYLDARTKFLFPDFFFKAAYLVLFDDYGYGWDNREERQAFSLEEGYNAAGVGLSWPTFVLQSFQINFTLQWARRTDNGTDVWYITLGPSF
jgi:outer membrane protein assembly factor BamA